MKAFLFTAILILGLNVVFAQQKKQSEIQTNSRLSIEYYNAKDYEKAIPLLLEVYKVSRNSYYFKLYLTSLIELKRFEEAEEQVEQEIKKQPVAKPEFFVHWGYVLKAQEQTDGAQEKYQEALSKIVNNKGSYLLTANAFLQWGEYEFVKKTYLQGRQVLPNKPFHYELARAFLYLRDYGKMMEEYLDLVRIDEKQLPRVQSSLSSAMHLDIDNGLRNNFRGQVLKRIQGEPNVIGYSRLLIWFFLQDKNFQGALRQSIALDKRTGEEDVQIAQLGQMALNNKNFNHSQKAYEYLLGKGGGSPFYTHAFAQNIHVSYIRLTSEFSENSLEAKNLVKQFDSGLEFLGYNPATLHLIQEYAHLLAFYLNESEKSIEVLKRGLKIPLLKPEQTGLLKTEMADVYVYANEPWEATLIYSQVIEANKKNSLGDEVKLKKAKLGFYLGNFSWAKAQLDVLKASTSKLTANDAMELSMLIGNNLNLDTTAIPLTMFAKADLRFFQNKSEDAMTILNGLEEIYPYHSLVDDILFRKSKIEIDQQNYSKAVEYLERIINDFSYELLADDALFLLAELNNYNLGEKEKAKELYKQMMVNNPGSVYVDESRKQYRELLNQFPDKEKETENQIFPELNPDEL
ncbi:MAG: tetratricopeptide repeat protein [Prolixibacteraceae bacterium]|jgi:tetratricopeptide (TPR) repeat protein|nr:tetratricopeptide repeat protein [Prolixibacteraceae bacterium]MBT6004923.1 tetratricopeptide repeat protein [Prolixibacteraceae bacterium]MBT6765705.1 tetratricopeptide repeat protein [Prolixibacteraceae bacterium]MBT6997550.1 tetratricopeptide repeat protein [Prolixibacteraceae bacterium]MBT7394556.1 tetratricopeptide repeat protein [Prolixibacteraceae bacterium]